MILVARSYRIIILVPFHCSKFKAFLFFLFFFLSIASYLFIQASDRDKSENI